MVLWKDMFRDLYLDEMLRWEGRGDAWSDGDTPCNDCRAQKVDSPAPGEFRCNDCFVPYLLCAACLVRRHRTLPFHVIEVSTFPISCHHITLIPFTEVDWLYFRQIYVERSRAAGSVEPPGHEVLEPRALSFQLHSLTYQRNSRSGGGLLRLSTHFEDSPTPPTWPLSLITRESADMHQLFPTSPTAYAISHVKMLDVRLLSRSRASHR